MSNEAYFYAHPFFQLKYANLSQVWTRELMKFEFAKAVI